jgi:hypothetical protein
VLWFTKDAAPREAKEREAKFGGAEDVERAIFLCLSDTWDHFARN